MKRITLLISLTLIITSVYGQGFEHFITRNGDRLMDGEKEFRFISFNIPNLHYVEDDLAFDRLISYRMPDDFEIRDALETIKQMGGQVARTYTLSVIRKNEPAYIPKYVLGPGQFNEEAFRTLDKVLAYANEIGIRLIIPFVNNFQWWGGAVDYAAFRGKSKDDFWTDPQLIADFKKTVEFVINRVNTVSGVPYKEDKSILAWETGNETQCPHSWTHEITSYIKSLDSNHLVKDGYYTSILREESIADDTIDIVQTHHYEKDPRDMIDHIRISAQKARGKKPYMLGEFGFVSTEATRAVLNTVIEQNITGALIWSLRYHHRDGGFFWHSEPAGGDFFKAYHWPGFQSGEIYDETNLMALMRNKAYQIRKMTPPALPVPAAPTLLPIPEASSISWQGSVGASGYTIERSNQERGPWTVIAQNVSDAAVQYKPLYNDMTAEIGQTYYYRVRATNGSGESQPSNVVGPVTVAHHTFIDEFANDSQIFYRSKNVSFQTSQARRFKEDIHRLAGDKGEWLIYHTEGPITACKLYTFADNAETGLTISLSTDGKNFIPTHFQKIFVTGQPAEMKTAISLL
jgi:mannan endo-1,4-beta-mannosidase